MRVSVIQMNQGSDKAANLAQARRLVEAAVEADRPGLVTLPETWTNLGGGRDSRKAAAEVLPPEGSGEPGGPAYEMLRGLARTHGIHVHGGSMIEDGQREAVQHHRRLRPARAWRSPATARSTCSTSPARTAPATGKRAYGAGDGWSPSRPAASPSAAPSATISASPSSTWRCVGWARSDLRALQLHPADRQGPLGGPAARPRHREPVLDHRRRLDRTVRGARGAAVGLRAFAGGRPLGACGRQGLGRHRLDDGAHRPRGDGAGQAGHAGAGTSRTKARGFDDGRSPRSDPT